MAAQDETTSSAWSDLVTWVYAQQRAFHRELTGGLSHLRENGGIAAAWAVVAASFLYGIFHAAGPGHGKAVLTTYLLTHRSQVKRGIALASAAAFCQGLVALILVYGLIFLAGWLPRDTSRAVDWGERLSFALVMAIGLWLAWRGLRSAFSHLRSQGISTKGQQDHHHHHGCHNHDHDHSGCGHQHGPSPEQLERATDLKTSIGVILAIGLRPCTGAVIVLVFAKASGMAWAGVGAVLAMAAGTAIAVTSLAFLTVHARAWIARLATRIAGPRTSILALSADLIALIGGLFLLVIGYSLLAASFATTHPLF
ncbi:MAG: nickel/cobalt transporter [Pseudomonadota bacterium]